MAAQIGSNVPGQIGDLARQIVIIRRENTSDKAAFTVIDGNGNGKVSRDEWGRAQWDSQRFRAFDANDDGSVSEEEFLEARTYEREFNEKDRDENGWLSRFEFNPIKFFRNELHGLADGAVEAVVKHWQGFKDRFASFDADGNGRVSRAEYIRGRRNEAHSFESLPIHPRPIPCPLPDSLPYPRPRLLPDGPGPIRKDLVHLATKDR